MKKNIRERAFVIDKQLQRLLRSSDNQNTYELSQTTEGNAYSLISMQAIVNAVVYPYTQASQQTLKLVNTSAQYVNWYQLILAAYTSLHSPMQVAASSVQNETFLVHRQGRGFTLKVLQEAPSHNEAYIILNLESLSPSQQEKGIFMHCMWEEKFYVIPFGLPTKKEIQILISTNDKAFSAIANTESHLYLS